jgi:type IV pilus assembly protein PilN
MIRINLLPADERKKSGGFKMPSISFGGAKTVWLVAGVSIYLLMVLAISLLQARNVDELEGKIVVAKEEAARLAPQLERIRQLQKEREEVNRRLSVIAQLDRDRYYRVKLLNDVSMKLPPNTWLTSLKEQNGTTLTVDGVTFSNFLIADLMTNLEKSERVTGVMLNIAEEGRIDEHKVIQFTLQSRITSK